MSRFYFRTRFALLVSFAIVLLTPVMVAVAVGWWDHNTLPTHPAFQAIPTSTKWYNWTAKRYKVAVRDGTSNPLTKGVYPIVWHWSGPTSDSSRQIHWDNSTGTPGIDVNPGDCYRNIANCLEWRKYEYERWTFNTADPRSAKDYSSGGATEAIAPWWYPSTDAMLQ